MRRPFKPRGKFWRINYGITALTVRLLDEKGKQIGVFVLSYLSVKLKIADKPNNSTWPAFYAVSILTGIGFTMSLFVGNLAFANDMQYIDGVKIGVLAGSLLSTVFGYVLLLLFSKILASIAESSIFSGKSNCCFSGSCFSN